MTNVDAPMLATREIRTVIREHPHKPYIDQIKAILQANKANRQPTPNKGKAFLDIGGAYLLDGYTDNAREWAQEVIDRTQARPFHEERAWYTPFLSDAHALLGVISAQEALDERPPDVAVAAVAQHFTELQDRFPYNETIQLFTDPTHINEWRQRWQGKTGPGAAVNQRFLLIAQEYHPINQTPEPPNPDEASQRRPILADRNPQQHDHELNAFIHYASDSWRIPSQDAGRLFQDVVRWVNTGDITRDLPRQGATEEEMIQAFRYSKQNREPERTFNERERLIVQMMTRFVTDPAYQGNFDSMHPDQRSVYYRALCNLYDRLLVIQSRQATQSAVPPPAHEPVVASDTAARLPLRRDPQQTTDRDVDLADLQKRLAVPIILTPELNGLPVRRQGDETGTIYRYRINMGDTVHDPEFMLYNETDSRAAPIPFRTFPADTVWLPANEEALARLERLDQLARERAGQQLVTTESQTILEPLRPVEQIDGAKFMDSFPDFQARQLYVDIQYVGLPNKPLEKAARVKIGGAIRPRPDRPGTQDFFALQAYFTSDDAVSFIKQLMQGGERGNEPFISLAQSIQNGDEQPLAFTIDSIQPQDVADHIKASGFYSMFGILSPAQGIRSDVLANLDPTRQGGRRSKKARAIDEEVSTWERFRNLEDDKDLGGLQGAVRFDTTATLSDITDDQRREDMERRSTERHRHRRPGWVRGLLSRRRTHEPQRSRPPSRSQPGPGTRPEPRPNQPEPGRVPAPMGPTASSSPLGITADHPGWGPPPRDY